MPSAQEIAAAVAAKVARGDYRFSLHAEKERRRDRITVTEFEEALRSPELVEDYPDDQRGHSCLVVGFTASGDPVHVVAGGLFAPGPLVIITVYRPDPAQWDDWRKRR